ncbi:MAG TPA: hypothetical protein VKA91_11465 [Nitrososphaeraceae archaeon]|nr:hypothetical protein [Nitrososphaeraceae archaeon]
MASSHNLVRLVARLFLKKNHHWTAGFIISKKAERELGEKV